MAGFDFEVVAGEPVPVVTHRAAFTGRCNVCGFVALGHHSASAARWEMRRHQCTEHADMFPRHADGSPCFHTSSDCEEHGSCIDCDMCKRLCECG